MDNKDYLLLCLSEECSEISEQCSRIAIRVSKILRFGADEVQPNQLRSNTERLEAELTDLKGTIDTLVEHGIIKPLDVEKKKERILNFMEYSKKLGVLD